MPNLLVIEAKPEIATLLQNELSKGLIVDTIAAPEVISDSGMQAYDLIVCRLPNSLDSWKRDDFEHLMRGNASGAPIIMIAGEEEISAMGDGNGRNIRVLQEPVDVDKLCSFIRSALQNRSKASADKPSLSSLDQPPLTSIIPFDFEGMIIASLAMREIVKLILEAASTDIAVLISGETGTGKELVAAAIHRRSKRKKFPYVAVNTGAMSPELITSELFGHEKGSYTGAVASRPGFFEQANRGTIFLDEISTMDEKSQVCLLRVLETKKFRRIGGAKDVQVDVWVIAATNENLEEAIKGRKFREDLYYRLDVLRIHLPPLRSRPGAVDLLTDHFVAHYSHEFEKNVRRVAADAYRYLRLYPWPGNVRELKNVIQRSVLKAPGEELTADLLPARILQQGESIIQADGLRLLPGMTLETAEKELIKMTLGFTKGNKKAAGKMLGISRRALYNKLKKFASA